MEDKAKRASQDSGRYVGAALLIVVGVAALVGNLGGEKYVFESIPFALGVAFLVAYALTRRYGYLVPGGILTGVGAGLLVTTAFNVNDGGAYASIGAGLGFLLIFVVDALVSRVTVRWWPVIPGALMIVIGSEAATTDQEVLRQLGLWSPVLLIVLGVLLLLSRARRGAA